jgi:hypothetical protein
LRRRSRKEEGIEGEAAHLVGALEVELSSQTEKRSWLSIQ